MTAFPQLQADYAAHGIATYPVSLDKVPAVRGYAHVGKEGSAQLALKFANSTAAGFLAGRRNRLTVIDIDSTDPRLADEVRQRFGPSPLEVETPSGGRHLYYRHNGEGRRIRSMPDVDTLGGGHVVAAGSLVAKGRYRVTRGSLDDLDHLPPIRQGLAKSPALTPTGEKIPRGRRNTALFEFCRRTVAHCDTLDQLLDAARTWADGQLEGGLPEAEIAKTCRSVWLYRGGRKRIMTRIVESPQFDALVARPDALALFAFLDSMNGADSTFMVAYGLGKARGWPLRFVPKARKVLLDLGIIEQVKASGKGSPALYRWKVPHEAEAQ